MEKLKAVCLLACRQWDSSPCWVTTISCSGVFKIKPEHVSCCGKKAIPSIVVAFACMQCKRGQDKNHSCYPEPSSFSVWDLIWTVVVLLKGWKSFFNGTLNTVLIMYFIRLLSPELQYALLSGALNRLCINNKLFLLWLEISSVKSPTHMVLTQSSTRETWMWEMPVLYRILHQSYQAFISKRGLSPLPCLKLKL